MINRAVAARTKHLVVAGLPIPVDFKDFLKKEVHGAITSGYPASMIADATGISETDINVLFVEYVSELNSEEIHD